jgi:hypothetical protein
VRMGTQVGNDMAEQCGASVASQLGWHPQACVARVEEKLARLAMSQVEPEWPRAGSMWSWAVLCSRGTLLNWAGPINSFANIPNTHLEFPLDFELKSSEFKNAKYDLPSAQNFQNLPK